MIESELGICFATTVIDPCCRMVVSSSAFNSSATDLGLGTQSVLDTYS